MTTTPIDSRLTPTAQTTTLTSGPVPPRHRRGWMVRRLLLVSDLAGFALAFVVAQLVGGEGGGMFATPAEYLLFLVTLPGWVVFAKLYGLYDKDDERADHSTVDEVVAILHLVTVGTWLLYAAVWITRVGEPIPAKVLSFWLSAILLVGSGRIVARTIARNTSAYQQNTIIVGAGPIGRLLADKIMKHPEYGLRFLGFVDPDPPSIQPALDRFRLLGTPDELSDVIAMHGVERVIVAFTGDSEERTLDLVHTINGLDIQIDIVPRLPEIMGPGIGIHTLEGLPLFGLPAARLSTSSRLLKRTLDIGLASLGLVLLAPLLIAIAIAIKLDSRGPVFFRQPRMGAADEIFDLRKFRTMIADADLRKHEVAHLNKHLQKGGDPRMFKIDNDPRVTRVGRVLRRYMLDELPQLLNVLGGTMSLVGPRPLILEEDRHVQHWARKRLDLKPGMTGLWQVLGRHTISFDEMVKLDYLYVTTWSLDNDLRLLLRTIPLVIKGAGGSV